MHQTKHHFLSYFLLYLLPYSLATDTITPSQSLKDGDLLISNGNLFALGFFTPGTSRYRYVGIWYQKIPQQTVVWVANKNNPINTTSGILSIDLQSGNLVLHDQLSKISYWSTNISIPLSLNSSLQLMDTGNLALFQDQARSVIAWQGFDHPSNTLLPQLKFGIDLKTGLNRYLTSWKSADDPSDGEYQMRMEIDGPPQIFLYKGSKKYWRTGSWDGIRLIGVPDMTSNFIFSLNYVENDHEVSLTYMIHNPSIFSRLVINESGTADRLTWQGGEHQWVNFWFAPKDQCDYYNHCGPYSDCDPYILDQFECSCLPGYEPKVQSEWSLRDAINGCIRMKAEQICTNGEGFVKLSGVKVPDLSNARVDRSLGLKGCDELCRKNCSCTAYANLDVSKGGSGCITWYGDLIDTRQFSNGGQDFYIRVSAAVLAKYSKKSKHWKIVVIAITACVSGILVLLLALLLALKKQKGKKEESWLNLSTKGPSSYGSSSGQKNIHECQPGAEVFIFDLKTIALATDHFSESNKLGEGGFGSVYKGRLNNGHEVAVKRSSDTSGQGIEEFKNEVTLIAKLQHRNLVRLLGCCFQQEEKILVYEYLPNKGLDNFIFDDDKGSLLNWKKRFEIILGIARGMVYLHRDSRLKIIHRDLKASNVLLDAALQPKISDFGMARLFGADQMEARTRRVVGTYGYMSPEYAMQGHFSEKSDVFSFGVLLLEIISGKKNSSYYNDDTLNLIGHVWNLWKEKTAMDLVDPSLGDPSLDEAQEMSRCIHIGLLCVQEHANDRPTMSEVLSMLSNETALPAASPGHPAFIIRRGEDLMYSTSVSGGAVSVDDATITMVDAR